jgi:hypothetical protein
MGFVTTWSTLAKSPTKIILWPNMNGFNSSMTKVFLLLPFDDQNQFEEIG